MTGFELRVWRAGMDWTQERAAEELGVSRRSFVSWENDDKPVSKLVELATRHLSLRAAWPDMTRQLNAITVIARH